MPTMAEQLTNSATDNEYRGAVSNCIKQLVNEGTKQSQAQAICYSQAKESTGRDYPKAKRVVNTSAGEEFIV